ncbi:MAG: 4Fe-4S dicluster domain-containing protein [Candidatus Undinarchaeales archaeon]|jgi:ferredoxin|nr:4Fe-4S dicluster domain-containing protein [Candidatus Undinarchaeales archaeon]
MPAVVDKTKCQKNYACIGVCPVKAIEKDADGFPVVETAEHKENKCIECGACEASCPTAAIKVQIGDTTPVPEESTVEEPDQPAVTEVPVETPVEPEQPEASPEPEPVAPEPQPEPAPPSEPVPAPKEQK